MSAIFISFFLVLTQSGFETFTFCREAARGPYEMQCVALDAAGRGTFRFRPRDADTMEVPIQLSADATQRYGELLAETGYLEDGDRYESGRRVADLGKKTMVVEGTWGRREAVFNFSTMREVTQLTSFFERLISQELLLFDIGVALDFDRLGIPGWLEQIEKDLRAERFADAERLVPLLNEIAGDRRLMNYARTTAVRLKEEIEEMQNDE